MTRHGRQLNYPRAGATGRPPEEWPPGFRRLRVSGRVGSGEADFAVAADAVMTWRMHRTAGVRFGTDAERAAPGVEIVVGLGVGSLRVHAPCRVVWTVEERRRTGWGYGTLPGHPLRGEEAFVVVQDGDGTVRLEVLAFSAPATRATAAAGPLLPAFQRWYARRSGRVLRRIVREEGETDRRTGRRTGRAAGRGTGGVAARDDHGDRDDGAENGSGGTEHP